MNCRVYIREFLSAHADGELSGQERTAADYHLRGCPCCQASFAEEQRVKALIHTSTPLARVPADMRLRIRAALGEVADPGLNRSQSNRRRTDARREGAFPVSRAVRTARWIGARPLRAAIPFAAVAVLIMVVAIGVGGFGGRDSVANVPATPVFDLATASFDGLARGFTPNVATESARKSDGSYYAWVVDRDSGGGAADDSADLARAYHDAGVPEEIYDFAAAGYGLYGGRIDQSVDGAPMTYTLYRAEKGEILSICMHASGFAAPTGARYWAGTHSFFRYKDHSLCLTFSPSGHFVSILVAQEPVTDLLRDVTLADASSVAS
ncbi:MAG TPA: zf-HC2 domain-containing protein [Candidatus Binataceae bacterium]|nr:zf-HC2 domain-containing protein [Candidatus Binataceae bacterium]